MRYSLVLASRERIALLRGLLDSLMQTTKHRNEIEIVAVFDTDDTASIREIPRIEETYKDISPRFLVRERSEWMHKDYINWACKHVRGKYCIVLNDDTRFINKDWDELAWQKLENYLADKPDGIVYGFTETFSNDSNLCFFPLISKKAIDILGFILPNERKSWSADHDIYAIYTHPLVNRKLDLPEIKIQHITYHNGSRARDAVSYRVEKIFNEQRGVYIPTITYADRLASHIIKEQRQQKNRVLVIYNICGIAGRENYNYYLTAIMSILNQKFDGFHVAISSCMSSAETKNILKSNLLNKVSYNWISDKLPLNITFNHTIRKCVSEFGAFESYLYIDSGVSLSGDRLVIQKMYDAMKSGNYSMTSAQVDIDSGYSHWGITIDPEKDIVVPVGKTINLHCQLFSHDLFTNYDNRIFPDIFAHNTSESIYTFMNAAIKKKWAICHDVKLHHEANMDGRSSGFLSDALLFHSRKSMEQICNEGHPSGFGYEEYKNVCMHNPAKFDANGYALDPNLHTFLKENVFLSKQDFDYDAIQHEFVAGIRGSADTILPSPNITCILFVKDRTLAAKSIESLQTQTNQDWECIVVGTEDFNDPRIKPISFGQMGYAKTMSEILKRNIANGHLICYINEGDVFYENAFATFVDYLVNNPHVKAMYASANIISEDILIEERRALCQRGACNNAPSLSNAVRPIQFCHTRDIASWLPANSWQDNPDFLVVMGDFMDKVGKVAPVYNLDIKIGQTS